MPRDLDDRVLRFACRSVELFALLTQQGGAPREIARQYLRSATSIGANDAEAAAGQSKADFIARVSIARKACREALFWLRLMQETRMLPADRIADDLMEGRQIAAILTAIVRKAKESDGRGGEFV
jgi:four helix bundle protein